MSSQADLASVSPRVPARDWESEAVYLEELLFRIDGHLPSLLLFNGVADVDKTKKFSKEDHPPSAPLRSS